MLKLAVIGFGRRTDCVIREIYNYLDGNLEISGVLDPYEPGVNELLKSYGLTTKFYPDVESLMKNSNADGVVVGTRCNLHTPYAIALEKYNVPIFLEKPVSLNMEDALSLEKAYKNSKTKVVVSFPLRVSPVCEYVKTRIESGAIGKPNDILAVNYVPYGRVYFEDFYRYYNEYQGLLLQKATHDLDYIEYLMGSPIKSIAATGSFGNIMGGKKLAGLTCEKCDEIFSCKESHISRRNFQIKNNLPSHLCPFSVDCGNPEEGMNEDSSSVIFEFENGARGVYTQVFYVTNRAGKRGATISGYDGTLEFDWYTSKVKYYGHHQDIVESVAISSGDSHFAGDFSLARNFIDVIRGKEESKTPLSVGLSSVYSCLAAKESLKTKKFEQVKQVGNIAK